jgi:hypothetical protein
MELDSAALAGVRDGPTVEYYEEYKRANRALDEIAARSADHINSLGHTAEVFPATIVDSSMGSDYQKTLSVGFQHKTAATRAGLGWIGNSPTCPSIWQLPSRRDDAVIVGLALGPVRRARSRAGNGESACHEPSWWTWLRVAPR